MRTDTVRRAGRQPRCSNKATRTWAVLAPATARRQQLFARGARRDGAHTVAAAVQRQRRVAAGGAAARARDRVHDLGRRAAGHAAAALARDGVPRLAQRALLARRRIGKWTGAGARAAGAGLHLCGGEKKDEEGWRTRPASPHGLGGWAGGRTLYGGQSGQERHPHEPSGM